MKHIATTIASTNRWMTLVLCLALGALTTHARGADFLTRLGIDATEVLIQGDRYAADLNPAFCPLDDKQVIALLDDVVHWQLAIENDEAEGSFSLVGVRPITAQHTLLIIASGFGDGPTHSIGIFDPQGRLTDYLNLGYTDSFEGYSLDHLPRSNASVNWTTAWRFEQDNEFVVERTERSCLSSDEPTGQERVIGRVVRDFRYAVDEQGRITSIGTTRRDSGQVIEQHYRYSDIDDLTMLPSHDSSRLDRLNRCAASELVQAEQSLALADEDYVSMAAYKIRMIVWDYFSSNPRQLFAWMYAHRDDPHNRLTEILHENMSSMLMSPLLIAQLADQIADPAAKSYITSLLSAWSTEQ